MHLRIDMLDAFMHYSLIDANNVTALSKLNPRGSAAEHVSAVGSPSMGSGRLHADETGMVRRCDAKTRDALERDLIRRGERVKRLLIVISTGEASSPGWEPAQQGVAQPIKPRRRGQTQASVKAFGFVHHPEKTATSAAAGQGQVARTHCAELDGVSAGSATGADD